MKYSQKKEDHFANLVALLIQVSIRVRDHIETRKSQIMKSKLTPLFLLLVLSIGTKAQGQSIRTYTNSDYDRAAAMLSGNTQQINR